ncbi:MAG: response regulator [Phycisphaerae bacterium]
MIRKYVGRTPEETDSDKNGAHGYQPSLRGYRILLAEDNPTNQVLVTGILKKSGVEVAAVENGKLAVDAALAARDEGKPFDVILMDIQMPVMGGYEAVPLLRQEGYTGPIIALTAHAMEGDRDKCIRAGCDDYVTKPIHRAALFDAIRKCLPGKASATGNIIVSDQSGDPDMRELIEQFVDRLPERVAALEQALTEQDIEALATLGHQLKGTAGNYGFMPISEAAAALERSAKARHGIDELNKGVQALVDLCRRARATAETSQTCGAGEVGNSAQEEVGL